MNVTTVNEQEAIDIIERIKEHAAAIDPLKPDGCKADECPMVPLLKALADSQVWMMRRLVDVLATPPAPAPAGMDYAAALAQFAPHGAWGTVVTIIAVLVGRKLGVM